MVVEEIFGITDLNGSATMRSNEAGTGVAPIGQMTRSQVLRKSLKILDDNLLIAQVHNSQLH